MSERSMSQGGSLLSELTNAMVALHREHFGLPVPASVYSRTFLIAALAEMGAFVEGIALHEEAATSPVDLAEPLDARPVRGADLPSTAQ